MAAEKIGPARCPVCKGTASVSLSKSQLCVLTCNACNCQIFCRSDRSDSLVRERLHAAPRPAPEAPAAAPAVPAPPVRTAAPTAAPVRPAAPAAPVRTGTPGGMGLLGNWFGGTPA